VLPDVLLRASYSKDDQTVPIYSRYWYDVPLRFAEPGSRTATAGNPGLFAL